MGKFQDVAMRRAAHGGAGASAPPLRDPHADADELHRRNRAQFGNPFRKGDKGLALASDEIDGEAEAATGVNKQRERRRRRQPSAGAGPVRLCCGPPCASPPLLCFPMKSLCTPFAVWAPPILSPSRAD